MQRAKRRTGPNGGLGAPGLVAGAMEAGGDESIEPRVQPLDAAEAGVQQLDRRQAPRADQPPCLDRREIARLHAAPFPLFTRHPCPDDRTAGVAPAMEDIMTDAGSA